MLFETREDIEREGCLMLKMSNILRPIPKKKSVGTRPLLNASFEGEPIMMGKWLGALLRQVDGVKGPIKATLHIVKEGQ